jgi:crotonobetainyl-CoA:carnitine CoA-transferase CaiB-like acyl-CoA transferase
MVEGPLDGIHVLEVANWLAAPAAGAVLADMGADVVKVEPPNGDPWRGFRVGAYVGYEHDLPVNVAFELDNRGKRGMTLDLENEAARSVLTRLASSADVLLTNLTPERATRFGLVYDDLSRVNPRLIYGHFTGYGVEGPDANRLGFDYAAFWARSGIMGLLGEEGRTPPLQRAGMGDHATSTMIACGVLAALFERERSGRGQIIHFSLLNSGLWVLGADVQIALASRKDPVRHDPAAPANPIWNTYRCADGAWLMLVMVQPDPYWPRVCAAIGRPELAEDPRYGSLEGRARHSRHLVQLLAETFASATRAEWGKRLDDHGLIWAPVQTLTEVVEDPQVHANGYFTTVDHPSLGSLEMIDSPFRFGRSHVTARGAAPELGQHTEEVLLEAGYSWDEIVSLREQGAL